MVKRALVEETPDDSSFKRKLEEAKPNKQTNNSTQPSLAKFFGTPAAKKRGQADLVDFPPNFAIYSWNVNGISATLQKGSLIDFMKQHEPTILCLNETKIDQIKLEQTQVHDSIPEGYA